jgi:NAD(P)-dependent dehydrogenase (short-subunit alcohol dehydrogenase family)
MYSLDGKRVLIVGGSSGIGLGTARLAAEAGARVTIAGRTQEKLQAAVKSLGNKVEGRTLDATNDKALEAFFAETGTWDHVVATTGAGGRGKLADIPMDRAFAAMDAKFWAYFRIARSAQIAADGSLTFVSGGLGTKPAPNAALVSAVNAAVEAMGRGLALDLAPRRVNTICPGPIDTPLWDQLTPEARKAHYERQAKTLPARRMGQPEDVGQAILMVMTNPFVTGTTLVVDGGALQL